MQSEKSISRYLLHPVTLLVVYVAIAVIASVQQYSFGSQAFEMPKKNIYSYDMVNNPDTMKMFVGHSFTQYNNYVVFRQSYFHLTKGKNLYSIYPAEQWDLYKYSPSFALLMGLLAYLPDIAGLIIWNLVNALALYFAVKLLPFKAKQQSLLLWFMLIELMTSLQNAQSNGLMAALVIAAYGCMEKGKVQWATLWLVLSLFIKVYGGIGFCLFLFYPQKGKFILYSIGWAVLFACLPLLVTPVQTLIWQYHNWGTMLAADQSASYGLSVMGWLHSWFGVEKGKGIVSLVGIILFLLPLARWKMYGNKVYRLLMLASMLIWVVIFNHKAESPTFIIAVAGVGIWYFCGKANVWRTVLLFSVFVLTCLSPTDIFPNSFKNSFLIPYVVKVIPCIIVWCVVLKDLLMIKEDETLQVQ